MNTDETTWDTDEVLRWVDNDYSLHTTARWLVDHYEAWRAAEYLHDMAWEIYSNDIDRDEVDWEAVVEYLANEEES